MAVSASVQFCLKQLTGKGKDDFIKDQRKDNESTDLMECGRVQKKKKCSILTCEGSNVTEEIGQSFLGYEKSIYIKKINKLT